MTRLTPAERDARGYPITVLEIVILLSTTVVALPLIIWRLFHG